MIPKQSPKDPETIPKSSKLASIFLSLSKEMQLSSRGLSGVLPPAGQIFVKGYLLQKFVNVLYFFVTFKQGASKGAASGGSDF